MSTQTDASSRISVGRQPPDRAPTAAHHLVQIETKLRAEVDHPEHVLPSLCQCRRIALRWPRKRQRGLDQRRVVRQSRSFRDQRGQRLDKGPSDVGFDGRKQLLRGQGPPRARTVRASGAAMRPAAAAAPRTPPARCRLDRRLHCEGPILVDKEGEDVVGESGLDRRISARSHRKSWDSRESRCPEDQVSTRPLSGASLARYKRRFSNRHAGREVCLPALGGRKL